VGLSELRELSERFAGTNGPSHRASLFVLMATHFGSGRFHGTVPGSDLRHASIDGEIYAGDVGTFIGGEEHQGRRDFLGLASAAERNLRG